MRSIPPLWFRILILVIGCTVFGVGLLADEVPRTSNSSIRLAEELVPFRRVLISPERLPAELERVRNGTLLRLSREDFEQIVARAAQVSESQRNPSRLIETHYRASLLDNALIGTGEWKIVNPMTNANLLPLPSMNLALRQVRWSDNNNVIIGDLDGKGLSLLMEQPGDRSISLEWSARGTTSPGGIHFDLRVPVCGVASLELDLPEDRVLSVPRESGLLSGPYPASRPERRLWRLGFAGQTTLDLTVRQASGPGRSIPLVVAKLHTTQELTPGQVQADFEFDLEVLHSSIRELICECEPSLRPYDVSIRNLEEWKLQPGSASTPSLLEIRLSEPFQGKSPRLLKIRCLAPLISDRPWTCPSLRLVGAVTSGETLHVRIDPEVRLEDWQSGGFRFSDSSSTEPASTPAVKGAKSDSGQVLTLLAGLEAGPNPRRPSALVKSSGAEYLVHQLSWWQVGPERQSLTCRLSYEMTRGRLFQLPVLLPAGWELERVDVTPKDLLRNSSQQSEKGRSLLVVDLQHGLTPSTAPPLSLRLQLRPTPTRTGSGRGPWPIPDVVSLGARLCEGGLAISVDSLYQAQTTASAAPTDDNAEWQRLLREIGPGERPPWGEQSPDFYYPFRSQIAKGSVDQLVKGMLTLRPRPTRIRARLNSQVYLASGRATLLTRIELHPEGGAPEALDLLCSTPVPGAWSWKTLAGQNQVKSIKPLHSADLARHLAPLTTVTPLQAAAVLAVVPPQGTWWRLTLARPLRERLELEIALELAGQEAAGDPLSRLSTLGAYSPLEAVTLLTVARAVGKPHSDERHWTIPLLAVPAAERLEGLVTVHPIGADLTRVESEGLREVGPREAAGNPKPSSSRPWRSYRYGHPPFSLVLHGCAPAAGHSYEALADQAFLTVYADPSGRLLHHFQFQVWNWRQRTLPVRLPAGAQVLAARIDGRWINQLGTGGSEESATESTIVFETPSTVSPPYHRFEVFYALDRSAWNLWCNLNVPVPVLPVRLVAFQRAWRLPPNVVPLVEQRIQRLPRGSLEEGINGTTESDKLGRSGEWPLLPAAVSSLFNVTGADEWAASQRQQVRDAVIALRRQRPDGTPWTLGKALERLVYDHFKQQGSVVLDTTALREAGLGPATALPPEADPAKRASVEGRAPAPNSPSQSPPFWESLGIVYLPCRSAPLLTTRQEAALWRTHSVGTEATQFVSDSIEAAVAEAVLYGHDRSGRFRTVADWLQGTDNPPSPMEVGMLTPSLLRSLSEHPGAEWSEWRPVAGMDQDHLLVIRYDLVPVLSLVLALLLLLAAFRTRRWSNGWRFGLLLGWLAVGGLGLIWLPASIQGLAWWPTLAGLMVALIRFLRQASRNATQTAPPRRPALTGPALTVFLALVLTASLAGQAVAPTPAIVYLIPGPAATPERQGVLVPPELLKQLETAAQRGIAALRGAVLLSANYEGRVQAKTAQFEAKFQIHNFSDKAVLVLPLGGIKLQEALLDGTVADQKIVALGAPREGYTLPIEGSGSHLVVLRFQVTLPESVNDDDRDLHFAIPDLAQSRLSLEVPAGARFLYVVGGRGAQRRFTDPLRVEADLGGKVSVLQVRWRQDGPRSQPAKVNVQEAYYWDIRATTARLLGVLHYTVSQGVISQLNLQLPRDLEVRGVEAEMSEKPSGATPRLREWSLTDMGSYRRLQLIFAGSVSGNVQVRLELIPRQPFGPRVVLPFPTPRDAQINREGLLAYRVEGLQATFGDGRGIKGIDAAKLKDVFARDFAQPWRAARREDLELPTSAFWSTPGVAPYLPLNLQRPPVHLRSDHKVFWNIRTQEAGVRATVQLMDTEGIASLLEWNIPEDVILASVNGADVHSWSRKGPRLQIWLSRPVRETTIQWTGWLPRRPGEATRFKLPCFRCLSALSHHTELFLSADDQLALTPEPMQNLQTLSRKGSTSADLAYESDQANYAGTFRVSPGRAVAEARWLTFAEVRDRRLTFVATLDYRLRRGELRHLTIQLRNWDAGEVQLYAEKLAQKREQRRGPAGRTWTLDLMPGVTDHYRLTLSGSMPLGVAPELLMPDVRVEAPGLPPTRVKRWLALAGSELHADAPVGLERVADLGKDLQPWNGGEPERLRRAGGTAWRVLSDQWILRLRPRDLANMMPFVQVFLTERTAAIVDGKNWIHQARFWLYHDAGADLRLVMPAGAGPVLSAQIDHAEVAPLQPEKDRLWLPLSGRAGASMIQLTWSYQTARETLDWPNLEPPQIEGVNAGSILWTVHIPPGYQLSPGSAHSSMRASAAGQELRRADAQLRLLAFLCQRGQTSTDDAFVAQILGARDRFDRHRRHAEHQLTQSLSSVADAGPEGQGLNEWLLQLRTQFAQISRAYELDKLNQVNPELRVGDELTDPSVIAAPRSPHLFLREQGSPLYWQAPFGTAAPRLLLIPEQVRQNRLAWIWSGLLVLLLAGSWGLTRIPWAMVWPEQIALLGCLGLLVFGPWGIYFLFLPIIWLVVRVGTLVHWLLSLWPQSEPIASPPSP